MLVFFIFSFIPFSAQEKFEKEYRVKSAKVPENALRIILKWNFPNKVKWFAEESNDGKTFEAKACFKKHNYSIEFSEKGELIDVEKNVNPNSLTKEIEEKIDTYLYGRFLKFSKKKIQIQYSGDEDSLYNTIFNIDAKSNRFIKKYELVVLGKQQKELALYEFLFDERGQVLKELKFKPTDFLNLEF